MEDRIIVRGGVPLFGEVSVSGGKNSAVAVIPAALLADDICIIENLPDIEDVHVLQQMLTQLGAQVSYRRGVMTIDPRSVHRWEVPTDLVRSMRASNYLMGVLLGRFGKAEVGFPGGCDIGERPMDQHLKGLAAMGALIELKHGIFYCSTPAPLKGNEIYLDVVSVGATINLMLAAAKAEGTTTIVNAAKEPHVVDVASFLSAMGAQVKGAGTDTIRIKGVPKLHGCHYSILPDQIETGTWMAIAAATHGDITIRGCIPYHMESVSAKLVEMGMDVREGEDFIRVIGKGRPQPVQIKTLVYPGFPTDLQAPFAVLLALADGTSTIYENIFESRFRYADELRRMGAQIRVQDRVAIIHGVDAMWGTQVAATDLRAGAAMIIAGLVAEGITVITNSRYIARGYERIVDKLQTLGADIHWETAQDQATPC